LQPFVEDVPADEDQNWFDGVHPRLRLPLIKQKAPTAIAAIKSGLSEMKHCKLVRNDPLQLSHVETGCGANAPVRSGKGCTMLAVVSAPSACIISFPS